MYIDPTGQAWYHWAIGGAIVVAAAAAVVVTAGGALPALYAVGFVASGMTAATTASTIAAGAFIGSSTALGGAALTASYSSMKSFNNSANWGTVASTVGGAALGAGYGYVISSKPPTLQASTGVCFISGTEVLTASGHAAIETIKKGDLVHSENPETGEKGYKRVAQTFVRETKNLVHIKVDGQEIATTPEHPFYVLDKGWLVAKHLRIGDELLLQSGRTAILEQVWNETLEACVKVYNFEVQDWHTYYVSQSDVLVHNSCTPPKNVYSSIKRAPGYSSSFIQAKNGLTKVSINNKELLFQLNQIGSGWQKVYQNGYIGGGKVSYHYFQDKAGKVFDFWVQKGWS